MGGRRKFNITELCVPCKHYMVDISTKLDQIIEQYIKNEEYFTINRARQYGKTTLLELLYQRLKEDYIVIDISFEGKEDYFRTLDTLTQGLFFEFQKSLKRAAHPDLAQIFEESGKDILPLRNLGERISLLYERAEKKVINPDVARGEMYGILKNEHGHAKVANMRLWWHIEMCPWIHNNRSVGRCSDLISPQTQKSCYCNLIPDNASANVVLTASCF